MPRPRKSSLGRLLVEAVSRLEVINENIESTSPAEILWVDFDDDKYKLMEEIGLLRSLSYFNKKHPEEKE